jgi:hypothetical protein
MEVNMVDDSLPANRYELRLQGEDTKVFGSAEKVAAAFHAADVEKHPAVHRFVRGQAESVVARTGPRLAPEYGNGDAMRILKAKQVDPVPPEGERFRDAYYAAVDASLRMRLEGIENLVKVQPMTSDGVWKLDRATYDDLEALAFARPERARQAWMDCVGTRFDAPTLVDYDTGQVVTLADTASLTSARRLHEYRFGVDPKALQEPQQSQPSQLQPAVAQGTSEPTPDKQQPSQTATPPQPQQEGPTMNMTRLQIDGVDVGRLAFEKHSTESGVFVDLTALDRSDKPMVQFTGVNKDELNNILGPVVGHEVAKFNGRTGEFKGEQLDVPAAEVAQAAKVAPANQAQQPAPAAAKVKQEPTVPTATAAQQQPAPKAKKAKPVKSEQQPAVPAATERQTPVNSVEPANGLAYAIDGSAVESLKFNRRGKGADQVVDLQGFNGKQQVIEIKGVPVAELARVVGEAAAQHITSAKGRSGTLKGEAASSPVEPPALAATAAARAGKAAPKQAPASAAAPQPRPAAPAGGDAPAAGPSDTVTLEVMRRGQRETISLQTGSNRELGLTMRPLQSDEARAAGVAGGLLVGGVSGAANRAGVLPGDVLMAVNGHPVRSTDEARTAAAKQAPTRASAPAQQASAPAQQPTTTTPTPAPVIEEPPAVKARREAERLAVEAIKSSLEERFIVRSGHAADSTEYRFRGEPGVLAFVDRGSKLATDRNEADVARGIVDLAQAKGWKALALAGTEDFRRNVWREAAARGLPASGYTPTKADHEWVAARQGAQQGNTVAKADVPQPSQQLSQRPAQASPQAAAAAATGDAPKQGPTKEQVMNAMRAGLRDLNMDKASSDRILERLSARLDSMLAQGKPLPNIARYDRAAASQMPAFVARQAQQGPGQQAGQPRARAR